MVARMSAPVVQGHGAGVAQAGLQDRFSADDLEQGCKFHAPGTPQMANYCNKIRFRVSTLSAAWANASTCRRLVEGRKDLVTLS